MAALPMGRVDLLYHTEKESSLFLLHLSVHNTIITFLLSLSFLVSTSNVAAASRSCCYEISKQIQIIEQIQVYLCIEFQIQYKLIQIQILTDLIFGLEKLIYFRKKRQAQTWPALATLSCRGPTTCQSSSPFFFSAPTNINIPQTIHIILYCIECM